MLFCLYLCKAGTRLTYPRGMVCMFVRHVTTSSSQSSASSYRGSGETELVLQTQHSHCDGDACQRSCQYQFILIASHSLSILALLTVMGGSIMQWKAPHLTPAREAGTRLTYPRGMEA